ncbi:MAG: hypothetical protein ACRDKW_08500 [Actinomycetota bacterium]
MADHAVVPRRGVGPSASYPFVDFRGSFHAAPSYTTSVGTNQPLGLLVAATKRDGIRTSDFSNWVVEVVFHHEVASDLLEHLLRIVI